MSDGFSIFFLYFFLGVIATRVRIWGTEKKRKKRETEVECSSRTWNLILVASFFSLSSLSQTRRGDFLSFSFLHLFYVRVTHAKVFFLLFLSLAVFIHLFYSSSWVVKRSHGRGIFSFIGTQELLHFLLVFFLHNFFSALGELLLVSHRNFEIGRHMMIGKRK